jgi:hypothetical protein
MLSIIVLFIRALGYLLGAVGLFFSLLFFFAALNDKKKGSTVRAWRNTSVSENPSLEVSRHG